MEKVDMFNNVVNVGDYIICISPRYKEFTVAQIVGFTPKGVRAKYFDGYFRKPDDLVSVFFNFAKIPKKDYDLYVETHKRF